MIATLACENSGAPGPIRTADTRFRRAVLCPLSYWGALSNDMRHCACAIVAERSGVVEVGVSGVNPNGATASWMGQLRA